MGKIVEYVAIKKDNLIDLEFTVKNYLKEDWQPLGNLIVMLVGHNLMYIQAMVKYEQS
jgi:hypothetical protein